jgi:ketosteroid isomerase-like protein
VPTPENIRVILEKLYSALCADDRRATVIFEGESTTRTGQHYNNRYLQILEFGDDGLIQQVWEFFDTDLANSLLFDPSGHEALNTRPFSY